MAIEQVTEVKFNLGATQLQIIGEQMKKASNCYMHGDANGWFHNLKAIKLMMISRLLKEERDELYKMENGVHKLLKQFKPETYYEPNNAMWNKLLNGMLFRDIEKYATRVNELLETKGFLVPLKEDKTNLFGQDDMDGYD